MWLGPQKGSYELQRYQSGQHGATCPLGSRLNAVNRKKVVFLLSKLVQSRWRKLASSFFLPFDGPRLLLGSYTHLKRTLLISSHLDLTRGQ